jgi:uncharacterized protein
MKTTFSILYFCISVAAFAQSKPVKIVFDVTSKDTLTHQAVLRHVTGMAASYPDSKFEVIVYGGAIPMVVNNKSSVKKDMEKLAGNKNVAFKVCAITMKRFNVAQNDLVPGVLIVPDGIIEIVNRQGEGWGYIKEAHN